nr:hypothetical protein [Tanacetum cinerariifolium]
MRFFKIAKVEMGFVRWGEVNRLRGCEGLVSCSCSGRVRLLAGNKKSSVSNSSSVSKGFQPKFTPKLIQSSLHTQSSQNEPKFQKDYKDEYNKVKAKLALLEASISTCQSPKPFQTKNKGLVVEMFDWDEEEVSDDQEMT